MKNSITLIVNTALLAALLCFAIASSVPAQGVSLGEAIDAPPVELDAAKGVHTIVGLGPAAVPDYEGSNDYELAPLPFAHVQWNSGKYISLFGPILRVNLLADRKWNFGPLLIYRPERDDVNDNQVDELKDVDAAVELGLFCKYNIEHWSFLLQGGVDVADGHDGFVLTAGAMYTHPFNRSMKATLGAMTSYANDDYMEAYFEIDRKDAERSGLPQYSADSGIKDVTVPFVLHYQPQSSDWGLMGIAIYKRLVDDAKNSPVTDDEGDADQFIGGVMVTYRF